MVIVSFSDSGDVLSPVLGNRGLLQHLPDSQTFLTMLLSLAEMPDEEAAEQLPEVRAARGLFR
jgi:hypothetical protein